MRVAIVVAAVLALLAVAAYAAPFPFGDSGIVANGRGFSGSAGPVVGVGGSSNWDSLVWDTDDWG